MRSISGQAPPPTAIPAPVVRRGLLVGAITKTSDKILASYGSLVLSTVVTLAGHVHSVSILTKDGVHGD